MSARFGTGLLGRCHHALFVWCVGVGIVLANSTGSLADLLSQEFTVAPILPSTYEPTVLLMEGVSSDSCVPQLGEVSREGDDLTVTLYGSLVPGQTCATVLTDWNEIVALGLLEEGEYSVTVDLRGFPPPFPSSSQIFGPFTFAVADRVGATWHGISTTRTLCRNRRTREKVVVRGEAEVANCEAAGLTVAPGDGVVIRTIGSVP